LVGAAAGVVADGGPAVQPASSTPDRTSPTVWWARRRVTGDRRGTAITVRCRPGRRSAACPRLGPGEGGLAVRRGPGDQLALPGGGAVGIGRSGLGPRNGRPGLDRRLGRDRGLGRLR